MKTKKREKGKSRYKWIVLVAGDDMGIYRDVRNAY
jgi:hypothetical protein